jgi:hypothetical protein
MTCAAESSGARISRIADAGCLTGSGGAGRRVIGGVRDGLELL